MLEKNLSTGGEPVCAAYSYHRTQCVSISPRGVLSAKSQLFRNRGKGLYFQLSGTCSAYGGKHPNVCFVAALIPEREGWGHLGSYEVRPLFLERSLISNLISN